MTDTKVKFNHILSENKGIDNLCPVDDESLLLVVTTYLALVCFCSYHKSDTIDRKAVKNLGNALIQEQCLILASFNFGLFS